jgi:competence protein ComGC
MREKKGFTVYELAIVLIVIGLIMGLVLKASAIIEVASLKKECAKFENMRSAYTIYYKLYNAIPGQEALVSKIPITTIQTSFDAQRQLIQAGLLNDNDFRVAINPAADRGYHYFFTRCIADNGTKTFPTGNQFYSYVFYASSDRFPPSNPNVSIPLGSVCIGVHDTTLNIALNEPATFDGFSRTTPQSLRAAYELYFDDKRIDHGYARRAHNFNSVCSEDTFSEADFEDEVYFLQEQLTKTDFIGNGVGADVPNRAGVAYFIRIY